MEVVGSDWAPPPPAPSRGRAPRSPGGGARAPALNPKYTFEQFVIGEGNRFAHAAALAAAELPGHSYNPLFLHGSPGIGKTHLLHAIGNYVSASVAGSRCATRRSRSSRPRSSKPFATLHLALQGELPARRRAPDRRHPVPGRPRQDTRGVLPHLQRAARQRPPARHDLRPSARRRSRASKSG